MKVKGVRWWVLGMIAIVSIVNYLDRGTLNYMWVANQKVVFTAAQTTVNEATGVYTFTTSDGVETAPADRVEKIGNDYQYTKVGGIATELGILDENMSKAEFEVESKAILARITIFFMIAYGLSQLISGRMYDKIGTRKGFVVSAIVWGASDALTFLASGVKSLTAFRFGLGLGEAGPWPGTVKSNAEWFPTKERAIAQGIFNAATSVGSVLAPIVISFLYIALGWRMTFVVVGAMGILWVIPWLIVNKKGPKEHPWITDEEKEYILSGQPEAKITNDKAKTWGQLLGNRKNWSLLVGRFFLDPVWWCFVTFIPLYLIEVFKLDIKEVALSAWVPYVGAAIGAFGGGMFSGRLLGNGRTVNFTRKCSMLVGACIAMPGIIGAATIAKTPMVAVLMMALILAGFQFAMTNIQTLASDLHTGKTVGSLAGLGGATAVLGTICSMMIVPVITQAGWTPFFIFGGSLFPIALISIFLLAGKIEQIKE
ncbi:MAG: MFS transporter [Rikenellaceae bacterium]